MDLATLSSDEIRGLRKQIDKELKERGERVKEQLWKEFQTAMNNYLIEVGNITSKGFSTSAASFFPTDTPGVLRLEADIDKMQVETFGKFPGL